MGVNITPSSVAVTLTEMGADGAGGCKSGRSGSGFRVLNPVIEPAEVISAAGRYFKGLRSAVVKIELDNVSQNYVRYCLLP